MMQKAWVAIVWLISRLTLYRVNFLGCETPPALSAVASCGGYSPPIYNFYPGLPVSRRPAELSSREDREIDFRTDSVAGPDWSRCSLVISSTHDCVVEN